MRRVQLARVSLGALAAAAFALFVFAARGAHPATSGSSPASVGGAPVVTSDDDDHEEEFGFGSSAVSPSFGAVPSVRSGGS